MKLPEPAFQLLWKNGEYKVTKPGIDKADCYTADQLKQAVRDALEEIELLLRDDGYAITFQTMGGYRDAVLKNIRAMKDQIK